MGDGSESSAADVLFDAANLAKVKKPRYKLDDIALYFDIENHLQRTSIGSNLLFVTMLPKTAPNVSRLKVVEHVPMSVWSKFYGVHSQMVDEPPQEGKDEGGC